MKIQVIREVSWAGLVILQGCQRLGCPVQLDGRLHRKRGEGLVNLVSAPSHGFQYPCKFEQNRNGHDDIPGMLDHLSGGRGLLGIVVEDRSYEDIGINCYHRSNLAFTAA